MAFEDGCASINGHVVPINEATIPVTDWGLTHSDITYDVVPVWDGAFFRLQDYLSRFLTSVQLLRLEIDQTEMEIRSILHEMVGQSSLQKAYVSMVASRGQPIIPGTRDPRFCSNHFYAWCVPYVHVFQPDVAAKGAHIWISEQVRRIPETSVNPRVKNYHWGDFTEGLFEAKEAGFDTVVLRDQDNNLTEGPGFNIFAVFGDKVVTPKRHCLEGITRLTALEIADELGFEVQVRDLPIKECLTANEIFATTSGGGPVGVARLGTTRFSNDAVGPITAKIRDAYWNWMTRPHLTEKIAYE